MTICSFQCDVFAPRYWRQGNLGIFGHLCIIFTKMSISSSSLKCAKKEYRKTNVLKPRKLRVWRGNTVCLDNYYFEKWPTFLPKSNILLAKVHRGYDFPSQDYLVFTFNKDPFYYLHLLANYFIWKHNWNVFQCENYFISNIWIL